MKCQDCGAEFEGNTCPNCNTSIVKETEISGTEEDQEKNISMQEQTENTYTFQNTELPKTKKKKPIRLILEIAGGFLLLIFMISTIVRVPRNDYVKLENDYKKLQNDYTSVTKANTENELQVAKLEKVKSEYTKYKERMKPFEELDEAEAQARKIEAEKVASDKKAAEEKAAADKKAAEEQAAADAAAAKAAEEARGYETGITYDQLARTPDDFMGQKVKFYGKVIQVIEDSSTVQLRIAVDDNYDTVLLGEYTTSIVSSRILEDDYVTIYGSSVGTITYQSTMGGNITIPGVYIEKIDQ